MLTTTTRITRMDGGRNGRHYQVEGFSEPFPSVTTVLGIINKPALIPWARNMALESVKETLYSPLDRKCSLPPACSRQCRKRADTVGEPQREMDCHPYLASSRSVQPGKTRQRNVALER